MFGLWKRRKPLVHAQWYVPVLDKQSNASEFYTSVENAIGQRNFPGVTLERIVFREGGLLSFKREYLRVERERAVLDICSADFGSCWYFSCRAATILWTLRVWELLVLILTLGSFAAIYITIFGVFIAQFVMLGTFLAPLLLCLLAGSWPGLDSYLMRVPVLGSIYESFFRRLTYYRLDTQRMFLDIVNSIVREQATLFCKAMGETEPYFVEVNSPEQVKGIRELWRERFSELANPESKTP
jgi:hypothetical protein